MMQTNFFFNYIKSLAFVIIVVIFYRRRSQEDIKTPYTYLSLFLFQHFVLFFLFSYCFHIFQLVHFCILQYIMKEINYKQQKLKNIMQEGQKKRKGISVSLTPDKNRGQPVNNSQTYNRGYSPVTYRSNNPTQIIPPIIHSARTNQHILYQSNPSPLTFCNNPPQYMTTFTSVRPIQYSDVKFSYSHVSKQKEIAESAALDHQLYMLNKQLQTKRQVIQILHKNTHNISPIQPLSDKRDAEQKKIKCHYSVPAPQPYQNNYIKPFIIEQKPPIQKQIDSTPQFSHRTNQNLQLLCSSIRESNINNYPYSITPQKEKQKQLTSIVCTQSKPVNKSIEKQIKSSFIDQNNRSKDLQIEELNKKLVKKNEQDKKNMKKLQERLTKLKWAEQKLKNIINICSTQ